MPPDLSSPEGRSAYRRELQGVARGARLTGIALALAGAAVLVARFFVEAWPDWLRWVALGLCLIGFVLMGVGVFQRTRYHLRRLAGG